MNKFKDFIEMNENINLNHYINIMKSFKDKYISIEEPKLEGNYITFKINPNGNSTFDLNCDYHLGDEYGESHEKNIERYKKDWFDFLEETYNLELPFDIKTTKVGKDSIIKSKCKVGWHEWKRFKINVWYNHIPDFKVHAKKVKITKNINIKKLEELDAVSGVILPTKKAAKPTAWFESPYNEDELKERDFPELLINFILDENPKSLKTLKHDFTTKFAKQIDMDNVFYSRENGAISNCLMLIALMNEEGYRIDIADLSGLPKSFVGPARKIYKPEDTKYAELQNNGKIYVFHLTIEDALIGKMDKEYIIKLYQNKNITPPALEYLKTANLDKHLPTELMFSVELLDDLYEHDFLLRGDVYFGMGSTRREQLSYLIRSGYVEEVKVGSAKRLYLPGKPKDNIDKKHLIKDLALKIKKDLPSESDNGYANVKGVAIEGDEIVVYISYVMAGMNDKTSFGAPTPEYYEKCIDVLEELSKLINSYSTNDIVVRSKEYAGFGGIKNLI
jgi:hypothetical protein